jgi:dihydrofolate reductase
MSSARPAGLYDSIGHPAGPRTPAKDPIMRQLIVTEFISLDGVVEAPGGEPGYAHTGWVESFFSDALGAFRLEEQLAADILLLGRVTYDSFSTAWRERDGEMADKINTMTKVVASKSIDSSDWHDTTVVADAEAEVAALKQGDGGPILVIGSGTLVQALLAAGLVDQLSLQVFPLILGSGARLFPESPDLTKLELTSSRPIENGVLLQNYRVA